MGERAILPTLRGGRYKSIGYTQDLKYLVGQNPTIMRAAASLVLQAETQYGHVNIPAGVIKKTGSAERDPVTGLEVVVLGRSTRDFRGVGGFVWGIDRTTYLKMSLKDQHYFVKKSSATFNPGFVEFRNTVQAKEALRALDWLTVVDAQLGYQDRGQSWFISKWTDLEGFFPVEVIEGYVLNHFGNDISAKTKRNLAKPEIYSRIEERIEQIGDIAKTNGLDLVDLYINTFYNPTTDRLFLLDVTTRGSHGLNQPIFRS